MITEASLMYRWGTRVDRRDQIAHLVDVGAKPGVRLHLQRFADGPPQGMFSPLNIFDLPDGVPSIAYTDGLRHPGGSQPRAGEHLHSGL